MRVDSCVQEINDFGLCLGLPYISVLTAIYCSHWISLISHHVSLAVEKKKKKQKSTTKFLKISTFVRQKELHTISCCRQPPDRFECSPGTAKIFCLPAVHPSRSHLHWLSESIKCSGETMDVNAAWKIDASNYNNYHCTYHIVVCNWRFLVFCFKVLVMVLYLLGNRCKTSFWHFWRGKMAESWKYVLLSGLVLIKYIVFGFYFFMF